MVTATTRKPCRAMARPAIRFFMSPMCARKPCGKNLPTPPSFLLAYFQHAAPPSFPIEDKCHRSVTPYGFQNTPPERFIAQWRAKARKLTLYDYWSIPDGRVTSPVSTSVDRQKASLLARQQHRRCSGRNDTWARRDGLGHYDASRLMWSQRPTKPHSSTNGSIYHSAAPNSRCGA